MYSADGKNRNHSGEGHAASNIITFVVLFAVLVAGFYATSFEKFSPAWDAWFPMLAVILGGAAVYGIAMHVFGNSDTNPEATANAAADAAKVDDEYHSALADARKRH